MPTISQPFDISQEGSRPKTQVYSSALATNLVVSAVPGILVGAVALSTKGTAQYIQVHDAASLPANGTAPLMCLAVGAGANVEIPIPLACTTGCVICCSSTAATLTVGSADIFVTALFR